MVNESTSQEYEDRISDLTANPADVLIREEIKPGINLYVIGGEVIEDHFHTAGIRAPLEKEDGATLDVEKLLPYHKAGIDTLYDKGSGGFNVDEQTLISKVTDSVQEIADFGDKKLETPYIVATLLGNLPIPAEEKERIGAAVGQKLDASKNQAPVILGKRKGTAEPPVNAINPAELKKSDEGFAGKIEYKGEEMTVRDAYALQLGGSLGLRPPASMARNEATQSLLMEAGRKFLDKGEVKAVKAVLKSSIGLSVRDRISLKSCNSVDVLSSMLKSGIVRTEEKKQGKAI